MNKLIGHFEIPYKLPNYNDAMRAANQNRYAGNQKKREIELGIRACIRTARRNKTLEPIDERVIVFIDWWEPKNNRDSDNIKSASKFILDALQKADILKNDGPKYVKDVNGHVHYPMDDNPGRIERVVVSLYSANE